METTQSELLLPIHCDIHQYHDQCDLWAHFFQESDELESLLRLLQLGLKALAILDSKDYTQDALVRGGNLSFFLT